MQIFETSCYLRGLVCSPQRQWLYFRLRRGVSILSLAAPSQEVQVTSWASPQAPFMSFLPQRCNTGWLGKAPCLLPFADSQVQAMPPPALLVAGVLKATLIRKDLSEDLSFKRHLSKAEGITGFVRISTLTGPGLSSGMCSPSAKMFAQTLAQFCLCPAKCFPNSLWTWDGYHKPETIPKGPCQYIKWYA